LARAVAKSYLRLATFWAMLGSLW